MSMSAMILNNCPLTNCGEPAPGVPMLILPGVSFAAAMNSGSVRTGNDDCTAIKLGRLRMLPIGAMSRAKSRLSF
jgi:hypothetical protein